MLAVDTSLPHVAPCAVLLHFLSFSSVYLCSNYQTAFESCKHANDFCERTNFFRHLKLPEHYSGCSYGSCVCICALSCERTHILCVICSASYSQWQMTMYRADIHMYACMHACAWLALACTVPQNCAIFTLIAFVFQFICLFTFHKSQRHFIRKQFGNTYTNISMALTLCAS